ARRRRSSSKPARRRRRRQRARSSRRRRSNMARVRTAIVVALAWIAAAGCAPSNPPVSSRPPITSPTATPLDPNHDPCAMRLHEASGALLLYYAQHRDLPPSLEVLEKVPGAEDAGEMIC